MKKRDADEQSDLDVHLQASVPDIGDLVSNKIGDYNIYHSWSDLTPDVSTVGTWSRNETGLVISVAIACDSDGNDWVGVKLLTCSGLTGWVSATILTNFARAAKK